MVKIAVFRFLPNAGWVHYGSYVKDLNQYVDVSLVLAIINVLHNAIISAFYTLTISVFYTRAIISTFTHELSLVCLLFNTTLVHTVLYILIINMILYMFHFDWTNALSELSIIHYNIYKVLTQRPSQMNLSCN